MRRPGLALALAFVDCTPAVGDDDDTSPPPEPTPDPLDCSAAHPLPVEFETVPQIVSAEDFVFGLAGEVFRIDPQGTLVSSTKEGAHTVLVPGVVGAADEGLGAAGISMLPDGDLVIADVGAGALLRVSLDGGRSTVLSGLAYPNGVEVHQDGWVAVSENDAGPMRRGWTSCQSHGARPARLRIGEVEHPPTAGCRFALRSHQRTKRPALGLAYLDNDRAARNAVAPSA
jgi:hypothetical protein